VNLSIYRTFVAVYRLGTATAAAAFLHMTQPGVTQHLQALEEHVERRLFFREARRMVPTEDGKALYARLAEPMDRLTSIEAEMAREKRGVRPFVRVGFPAEYFYAVALGRLTDAPCRLRITFGLTTDLIASLVDGSLDVVVATQRPARQELVATLLRREGLILIAPSGITVPRKARNEPDSVKQWLEQQHWLAYSAELPAIRRFWRINFGVRPTLDPVLIVPNFIALIRAVSEGAGLTVAPDYLCNEYFARGTITTPWPQEKAAENQLFLVHRLMPRPEPLITETLNLIRTSDRIFEARFCDRSNRRGSSEFSV
jgi:DNA-binding transcriptional LysR family regulator